MALTKATEKSISDNLSISGIASASNFKTGTTDVHNVGVTAGSLIVGSAVTCNSDGINVTGIVTATSFVGSGANLTGIDATSIKHTDGNVKVQAINTGANLTGNLSVTGNATVTGTLGVGGVLTYEDVTNVDSVGVITAREGIFVPDNKAIHLGNVSGTGDLQIYHDTSHSYVKDVGQGDLVLQTQGGHVMIKYGSDTMALFQPSNKAELYYANSARLATSPAGINITGGFVATGDCSLADKLTHAGDENTAIRFPAADTITAETAGTERLRIDSVGNLSLGKGSASSTNYGKNFQIHANNTNGAALHLTDNNTGSTNGDGFHIISTSNIAYLWQRESAAMVFGTAGSERLRIASNGQVGIGDDSPDRELVVKNASSNSSIKIEASNASTSQLFFSDTDAENVARISVFHGSGSDQNSMIFDTGGASRLAITSDGKLGVGLITPANYGIHAEQSSQSVYYRADSGSVDSIYGSATSLGYAIAGTTSNHPFVFFTNNAERVRITQHGTITNTTTSSHSQGAGTFNIKGIINQYSQGSGSGLIFDCDFGRLTGYGDDTNVGNGTNLSACLAHSTTDWTSNNSNTPITVNNGTFQYRVGFGGYMEGISNGGRVSVGAGSGNPAMSDKLNTANMTIETWCWYDGDGREVIVSRYGSGFPNNFNMIADPNGQFHYNSSGAGASGGNVSGEHFPDKTWHHHLWQYESGVHRWYINGAFANSRSAGSSVAVASGTGFGIFSRADDYERWRGKIAIVRIYNRALTATEIKNHFELERGRFGV